MPLDHYLRNAPPECALELRLECDIWRTLSFSSLNDSRQIFSGSISWDWNIGIGIFGSATASKWLTKTRPKPGVDDWLFITCLNFVVSAFISLYLFSINSCRKMCLDGIICSVLCPLEAYCNGEILTEPKKLWMKTFLNWQYWRVKIKARTTFPVSAHSSSSIQTDLARKKSDSFS